MSTRTRTLLACALLCLLAWPVMDAAGARSKRTPAKSPSISAMAPMKLGVGDTLTIRGKNFVRGKRRNTVVFKRDGGRAVFVKADTATTTRIKVKIPAKLARFFPKSKKSGEPIRARFRVRVLARRFGKRFTSVKASPLIGPPSVPAPPQADLTPPTSGLATPAPAPAPSSAPAPGGGTPVVDPRGPDGDCDGDTQANGVDGDDDNDLLSDALEVDLGLDQCAADTDTDGMQDAWEYESAIDLNIRALPYPGKRPYPNPLDGSDRDIDFDGDGLTNAQEHALWQHVGPRSRILSYSGGQQSTGGAESVPAPADPRLAHLDLDRDGFLSDDERDGDRDRLGNWDEFNGRMTSEWWKANHPDEHPYTVSYAGTSAADADSDGDGVLDGDDDQDFDDVANVSELTRGPLMNHPFNPCLPDYESRTCSKHPPLENRYPPFDVSPLPANPVAWPRTAPAP